MQIQDFNDRYVERLPAIIQRTEACWRLGVPHLSHGCSATLAQGHVSNISTRRLANVWWCHSLLLQEPELATDFAEEQSIESG